jgi:O-antigen/teichoic acid export membrane protein
MGVAGVAAIACWILVPRYGLIGAAWATGVTHLAAAIVPPLTFLSQGRQAA